VRKLIGTNLKTIEIMKGARTLVVDCANVHAGENILVVTDTNMPPTIYETLAAVAREQGANVTIAIMSPRGRHGQEPPEMVAASMKKADVIFTPVSRSITHTSAAKNALKAGARAVMMSEFTEGMMVSGGIKANFLEVKPIIEKVAQHLKAASVARVTSPKGTNLTMNIKDRGVRALTGVVHDKGSFAPVPTLEACTSPLEGTTQGVIVCDASVSGLPGVGIVKEPIVVTVKDGLMTEIKGGEEARILRDTLESTHDPNVYNIAELGIGLNPECVMVGMHLEDEGVFGTIHIGIGSNITWGGKVKAATHMDLIMWRPRLELDGKVILEDHELRI